MGIAVVGALLLTLAGGGVASSQLGAPARTPAFAPKGVGTLPASAYPAVSATLGAGSPAYAVRRSPTGFRLIGGGVAAQFDASGVSLQAGGVSLAMEAAGVGRAGRLEPAAVRSVHAKRNRVSLVRDGLEEWYKAGPFGIEQGFTLSRRPAGEVGPLTLALRLGGNVRAHEDSGSVLLTRADRTGMSYGELWASDAKGRPLHAELQLQGGRLLIHVWDRHASYPVTIDPLIQPGNKLTPSDEVGAGKFGYSVALSADGNTALIGGAEDNGKVGAAWVFTRTGSTWTQQGSKLTGAGESGAGGFGVGVALSADGNTALIGGGGDNGQVGAAWVFTRSGSSWTPQGGKLTGTGESGAGGFGVGVTLSADGNTAVIGGPTDNSNVGAAWVFTRANGAWTQQGSKLTGSGANSFCGTGFGSDVALAAMGTPPSSAALSTDSMAGAAWAFTRTNGIWSQQGGKITGTGVSGQSGFGWSVALSADGHFGLIGAPGDAGGSGKAYWFANTPGTWSQQTSFGVGTGAVGNARFGSSVALSSDGSVALIGGNEDATKVGAAWLFTRSANTWSQQGTKLTGNGELGPAEFGYADALSSDGNTALVGGHHDNTDVGATWVFATTVPDPPTAATATAGNGQASVSFAAPASNGGAAIDRYTVTSTPEGKTATGTSSPLVVTGLTSGVSYTFTVTAHNTVGESAPSTASNAVTPFSPPGAPTGATATPGNGSASVAFSAPASDGGAAITFYTVTSFPDGKTATGTTSPLTVNGLTNGTSYTFTVTAHNVAGDGAASAPSAAVTPRTVPGSPTAVSAAAGNAQATVSFGAPASDGGASVTSYTVTSSPDGKKATGTTSPLVVTGLTNGVSYTFTVTAHNVAGDGGPSAPSNAIVPGTTAVAPGAPTNVAATAGNAQAWVTFTPPASDGGAAITSYTVTASPGGQTASGSAAPILVTGLTNGQSYTFTVKASNSAGPGPSSSPSAAVEPFVPGRPPAAPSPPSEQARPAVPAPPQPSPRVPLHQ